MNQNLAIDGGTPVRNEAWPSWPQFDAAQRAVVDRVLESGRVNYWTGGEGRALEREFAAYCGVPHAVALMNGTVALEAALAALGVGAGDEVIVPARTFIASASAVVARGAVPVICDVDADSQTLTADTVAPLVGPRTRCIIAVHLAGWPCPMDELMQLSNAHGLGVIEDCAQAHGATLSRRAVGSLGHVAAFSFCQDKIMTTGGEGGMLTTRDEAVWRHVWSLKDHGKDHDAVHAPHDGNGFRWLHHDFGTNWRMTEMQAAIGRVQLDLLPDWLDTRRRHAAALDAGLADCAALRLASPPPEVGHARYKYYAFLRPETLKNGWDRDRVLAAINAEGVPAQSGSCSEIYLEQAFARRGFGPAARLPVARRLGETSLMLQVHPTLDEIAIDAAVRAVRKVLKAATR
ncbi:MAG: DegT/DnrJ/EryC1/StrS aminotransferase family protein [Chromatiales bacterium]|nr:DegT/DnrJ/EryC1/StrS aminotransferase family protein [Chromatiales bacterium]